MHGLSSIVCMKIKYSGYKGKCLAFDHNHSDNHTIHTFVHYDIGEIMLKLALHVMIVW